MMMLVSAGTGVVAVVVVFVAVIGALLPGGGADADAAPACAAPEDIPPKYYDLYVKAGEDYGIPSLSDLCDTRDEQILLM